MIQNQSNGTVFLKLIWRLLAMLFLLNELSWHFQLKHMSHYFNTMSCLCMEIVFFKAIILWGYSLVIHLLYFAWHTSWGWCGRFHHWRRKNSGCRITCDDWGHCWNGIRVHACDCGRITGIGFWRIGKKLSWSRIIDLFRCRKEFCFPFRNLLLLL